MSESEKKKLLKKLREIAAPLGQDSPNRLVLGKYEVIREIGEGAMGRVYEAEDPDLRRRVAVKVLSGPHRFNKTLQERFHREARAMAGVTHPNVVSVHDAGEAQGQMYLVMQLVEGEPFRGNAESPLSVVPLLQQAARGVAAAHEKGVVHRDLKPANILISRDGVPMVADFGLARLEEDEELTRTGVALGTPLYMAPEQVMPGGKITPRSDVYALGIILYELLTGRTPFSGMSSSEIFQKILNDTPDRPQGPEDLVTICLKAIEKDPDGRYESAREFADDLERFLKGEAILGRPASPVYRIRKRIYRHRRLIAGAAMVAGVGMLLGALLFSEFPSAEDTLWTSIIAIAEKSDRLMRSAEVSQAQEELDRGIDLCRRELVQQERAEVHYFLGRLLRMRGWRTHEEAEREFTRALELDPALSDASIERGLVRLSRFRRLFERHISEWMQEEGVQMWEKPDWESLIRKTPELVELRSRALADLAVPKSERSRLSPIEQRFGRAEVARLESRQDDALIELGAITTEDPLHARAWFSLALTLHSKGDMEGALGHITDAINRHRGFAEAYAYRSRIHYFKAERTGETLRYFQKGLEDALRAIALGYDTIEAYHLLGMGHQGLGQLQEAVDAYSLALERERHSHITLYNRGLAYSDLNQRTLAIQDYTRVLELHPRHAAALNNRSNLHSHDNKPDLALKDADEAIRIRPGYALAWVNRGTALTALDRGRDALAALDQALKLNPNLARAWFQRGFAHHKLGDRAKARDDYEVAVRHDPGLKRAWHNIGALALEDGRTGEALEKFNKALAIDPDYGIALVSRGQAFARQKSWQAAIDDINKAEKLGHTTARGFCLRGEAHQHQGNREKACADYRRGARSTRGTRFWRDRARDLHKKLDCPGSDF